MKKMIFLFCMAVGCCTFTQAQDAPKDSTLKEYIGKYLFPSGSVIAETNVSLGDDGMLTSSSSAGVSELVKREKDVFEIPKFQGTAKFVRDTNGKVMGVVIDAMGYHLEGAKSENGTAALFFPAKTFVATHTK